MKKQELAHELAHAFEREDAEKVRELIALGADINASGRWSGNCTMLWWSVNITVQEISKPFRDLAAGLSEFLPSVSRRDHAAEREKQLQRLRMLINAKADINKPCHGSTPLRIAVCGEDLEVVKLLLASGADPNAETFSIFSKLSHNTRPGYWNTVFHEAVEKNALEIVKALLDAGADHKRTDHEGNTPLTLARNKGLAEIEALLTKTGAKE
jgi:ankyrin repeat protein